MGGVMQLDPTEQDKRRARKVLPRLLARPVGDAWDAAWLMSKFVPLLQDEPGKRQVRDALVRLLASETRDHVAVKLASGLVQLDPTAQDQRHVRDALLRLLSDQTNSRDAAQLVSALVRFDPTAQDKRQVRETLLRQLASETRSFEVAQLVSALVQFDPTAQDKRQVGETLLRLLPSQAFPPEPRQISISNTALLVDRLVLVTTTARTSARSAMRCSGCWPGCRRPDRNGRVGRRPGGRTAGRRGGAACLDGAGQVQGPRSTAPPLAGKTKGWVTEELASEVVKLDPTARKRQVREALLRLLAGRDGGWGAEGLAGGVVKLDATEQDKRQIREALLMLLTRFKLVDSQTSSWDAARLTGRWSGSTRQNGRGAEPAMRSSGSWPARTTSRPVSWWTG